MESYAFDSCNLRDNRTVWKIHVSEHTFFLCDAWTTMLNPHESTEQQLHFLLRTTEKSEKEKWKQQDLQAKASIQQNSNLWNDYDNFNLREKLYENCYSKKIVVFVRRAIVNRTDIPLMIGSKDKAPTQLDPHSSCMFNIVAGSKMAFKAPGFGTDLVS